MTSPSKDFEFYCHVFDQNIPHLCRPFLASVEFKTDQLLVMCLDGAVQLPDIYIHDRRASGRLHQIGYRSIRYVKRVAREVTINSDRKKLQFALLCAGDQVAFDALLNSITDNEPVFQEVDMTRLIEHMGVRAHRRYEALLEAVGKSAKTKYWLGTLYPSLAVSLLSTSCEHSFELYLVNDFVHQKKLNLIVAAMQQEMRQALKVIEQCLGYSEDMCANVFELIAAYKKQKKEQRW